MTPGATNATQTAQHLMTGATLSGGFVSWLGANADAITAIAVASTAIASVIFGAINARSNRLNAISNAERNNVNRSEIVSRLIIELENSGEVEFTLPKITNKLRKMQNK